jgi:TonB family protein
MNTADLIYQPRAKWRLWLAFACAAALHLAAVSFARTTTHDVSPVVGPEGEIDSVFVPMAKEQQVPVDGPGPDLPLPTESSFPEENRRVQPRKPKSILPATAIRSSGQPGQMLHHSAAKIFALYAPRPDYPYHARREHSTGAGLASLTIDSRTGVVTQVDMTQNTGTSVLDISAAGAFRRWRFKPGTVQHVRIPFTFTLSGACY